jgi:hypothetical protein
VSISTALGNSEEKRLFEEPIAVMKLLLMDRGKKP